LRITPFSTHLWGPQEEQRMSGHVFFEPLFVHNQCRAKFRHFWIRKWPLLWHMPKILNLFVLSTM
jgi:hypothetical protein